MWIRASSCERCARKTIVLSLLVVYRSWKKTYRIAQVLFKCLLQHWGKPKAKSQRGFEERIAALRLDSRGQNRDLGRVALLLRFPESVLQR